MSQVGDRTQFVSDGEVGDRTQAFITYRRSAVHLIVITIQADCGCSEDID